MTGNLYGCQSNIMTRTASLSNLYNREFGSDKEFEAPKHVSMTFDDDETVLQKARNSKNGQSFSNLYDQGDTSAYGDDDSAADQALCNYLAYWTNGDASQMDRLFRSSALYRDKWDANNGYYADRTIKKAISGILPNVMNSPENASDSISQSEPRPQSAAAYQQEFENKLAGISDQPKILTGFPKFDSMLGNGLLPEIHIIAGQTGTGKTSFALQIADHIAGSGQDVLYFALEMSRLELISKSISRISFINDPNNSLTARDVMFCKTDGYLTDKQLQNLLISSRKYFSEIGPNMFIPEIPEPISINGIMTIVKQHIQTYGKPAIIVIDYLQLLAPVNEKHSDKQNVDVIMRGMKQINMVHGIPVLAISSLNRQSYTEKSSNSNGQRTTGKNEVQLSGLKESGSIEYTAGIVLGMNLISTGVFSQEHSIDVKLLKGRFIETNNKSQTFTFNSKYSYFTEK